MRALLSLLTHLMISVPAALAVGLHPAAVIVQGQTLWGLAIASAVFCTIGFHATVLYLDKPMRLLSVVLAGYLCGVLCSALLGLTLARTDYSLVLYLALLAPTLLGVLLASLLDRSRSGWAPRRHS